MKKFLLVFLFLSVLLITGCSKDDGIKGIKITSDNVKEYLNVSCKIEKDSNSLYIKATVNPVSEEYKFKDENEISLNVFYVVHQDSEIKAGNYFRPITIKFRNDGIGEGTATIKIKNGNNLNNTNVSNFSIQGYNIQDIDAKLVEGLFLQ